VTWRRWAWASTCAPCPSLRACRSLACLASSLQPASCAPAGRPAGRSRPLHLPAATTTTTRAPGQQEPLTLTEAPPPPLRAPPPQKLAQEDPSFGYSRDEETGQTVIEGMGELHLEIIVDRLRREFKVAPPAPPCAPGTPRLNSDPDPAAGSKATRAPRASCPRRPHV
jgi:hypothetical protein